MIDISLIIHCNEQCVYLIQFYLLVSVLGYQGNKMISERHA